LPADQAALGHAAHARGLYRAAAQLCKNAAASGNVFAAFYLSRPPPCLRGDARAAYWASAHVSLDNADDVAVLLGRLREAGAHEQATTLAHRAAAHVSLDNADDVAVLLDELREAGAHEQATTLAHRAAAHVSLDNPYAVARLLDALRKAGAHEQATTLAHRAGQPGRCSATTSGSCQSYPPT
jgi:hypothetical protein